MKEYPVTINGIATTVQLSDDEAKARGLLADAPTDAKAATAPANKARTAANKTT